MVDDGEKESEGQSAAGSGGCRGCRVGVLLPELVSLGRHVEECEVEVVKLTQPTTTRLTLPLPTPVSSFSLVHRLAATRKLADARVGQLALLALLPSIPRLALLFLVSSSRSGLCRACWLSVMLTLLPLLRCHRP